MKNNILKTGVCGVLGVIFMGGMVFAQSLPQPAGPLSSMITELEKNNTGLHALRQSLTAEKAGNRVGLAPEDPQIGINYLKPNPRLADHRLDYSISQELEFPTVYSWRKKVARGQDEILDQHYQAQRSEIIGMALQIWLEWIYLRENKQVLSLQQEHAGRLAAAYQQAFEAGSISVLERNRIRIHAANARKAFELNEIDLQTAWQRLLQYNGGQPFSQLPEHYPDWPLPVSFEAWFAGVSDRQGALQILTAELGVQQQQERLAAAMQWPSFSLGYMREQDIEVDFRGVTFGLSLPLWHNRQQTRHARLQSKAQESLITDVRQQFELEQRQLYARAKALGEQVKELRQTLTESREPALLTKALELGEISLVDYLVEQAMYYEMEEKLLEAELEYFQTQASMRKWMF